jgi:hypothetical protein
MADEFVRSGRYDDGLYDSRREAELALLANVDKAREREMSDYRVVEVDEPECDDAAVAGMTPAIDPYAQVTAIQEARTMLLRGKFEGNSAIDAKLTRVRAYLEVEEIALTLSVLSDPEPVAAGVQNG